MRHTGRPAACRRVLPAVAAVGAVAALGACGAEFTPSSGGHAPTSSAPATTGTEPTGTETTDSTDSTDSSDPAGTTGTTTAPDEEGEVASDVVGRNFDLGTIVGVEQEQGVDVVVLDRWTAYGVSDEQLAANGVELTPHTEVRFQNQNNVSTYRIPVAPEPTFSRQECVSPAEPPEITESSLEEFTELEPPSDIVLVVLDGQGRLTEAYNDPAC